MSKDDRSAQAVPAVGSPVERGVGRPVPERCKDCGLMLAPRLRLYCTKCVQQHLKG